MGKFGVQMVRTIQKPNFKTFGFGMSFGFRVPTVFKWSVFRSPLCLANGVFKR